MPVRVKLPRLFRKASEKAQRPKRRLSFPNKNRYLDLDRMRIHFWAHAGALEISCFLEVAALQKLFPDLPVAEADLLIAFDAAEDRIREMAAQVYESGKVGAPTCYLYAADF